MKIRITSPVNGPGKDEEHKIGEVIEVSEKVGNGLIDAKSAKPVSKDESPKNAKKNNGKG